MNFYSEPKLSQILSYILYIFGLWPSETWHSYYKIYSFSLHLITSLAFILLQIINFVIVINDLDLDRLTQSLYPMLTVLAYIFKLINYFYYADNIIHCRAKLMEIQKNNWTNESVFHKKLKQLNKLVLLIYCAGNLTLLVACFKTLLPTNTELPIPNYYPLDWKCNRIHFWIVYFHVILGGFVVINCNLGMDCYVYYLMGMTTAQCQILNIRFQHLGMKIEDRKGQLHDVENTSLSIKVCIQEHQEILELVSDITGFFSMQFFVQICLSGTIFSGGIYQVTTMSPLENIYKFAFLISFMITITSQTFLYTYYGNGILTSSDLLSNGIYSSNWYVIQPCHRKELIIILERLKRPCEILAGKLFPLNLTLFTTIINFAYRLYTLFKNI